MIIIVGSIGQCSDSARYRPYGEIPYPRLRVSGKGPQAVHGRLRQYPQHEQRQSNKKTIFLFGWFQSSYLLLAVFIDGRLVRQTINMGDNGRLLSCCFPDLFVPALTWAGLLSQAADSPPRSQTAKFAHQRQGRAQGTFSSF